MFVRRFVKAANRYGWRQAAVQYGHKGLACTGLARFLQVLRLDRTDIGEASLEKTRGLEVRLLSAEELNHHAEDKRLDMDRAFIEQALGSGSVCQGVHVDGVLAAYTWYGRSNIDLFGGLMVSVGEDVAYAYKGFTLPEYRERRCLTVNLRHALTESVLPNTKRLVCLVEASNLGSRIAVSRQGFRCVGWLCVAGRPPLWRSFYLGGVQQADRLRVTMTDSAAV